MRALGILAIVVASVGATNTAVLSAQEVPDNLIEKGYTLEVQFSAERVEYMSPSVSITKIRGFRDRQTCWKHAASIRKAIEGAAKDSTHTGKILFSCNEDTDFRKQ